LSVTAAVTVPAASSYIVETMMQLPASETFFSWSLMLATEGADGRTPEPSVLEPATC
jgi:hypothetical protein